MFFARLFLYSGAYIFFLLYLIIFFGVWALSGFKLIGIVIVLLIETFTNAVTTFPKENVKSVIVSGIRNGVLQTTCGEFYIEDEEGIVLCAPHVIEYRYHPFIKPLVTKIMYAPFEKT